MTTMSITEATVEQAALEWFEELGYRIGHALTPSGEDEGAERRSYADVVLEGRLRAALARLNPHLPVEARDGALRQVLRPEGVGLVAQNRHFHRLLIEGVPVEYRRADGSIGFDTVSLIDWARPKQNDWLAANQISMRDGGNERRADIVVFVNGLPLAVIELKNPLDENATLQGAYNQLQTYQREFPALFASNEILVVSDGREARAGTLTADWERFMPWKTIDGQSLVGRDLWELEALIKGIFERGRLLDLVRHFIVFEDDGAHVSKKVAAYHQYYAVNKAVEATVEASSLEGDRRAGVVWHTQGSGKSLTMAFYAGKIALNPAMANPTLVVLTDRNDLDDQLFAAFAGCQDLLRQKPVQAESREHLRQLLSVASGGIVFTTIQKFLPPEDAILPADTDGGLRQWRADALSPRTNIVFIADEAHRSQYGFAPHVVEKEGEDPKMAYGLAQHMRDALPNASYIGFTGTPVELRDRSTPAVFGDYIDIYDIHQAVDDGATVKIYYEPRLAKLKLDPDERPNIDPEFEQLTEDEELDQDASQRQRKQLASKWAQQEKLVGTPKRIQQVAADLVVHAEARMAAIEGKVMVVCMSRRICVDLYDAIVALRPEWHDENQEAGVIKVVMTGAASDEATLQPHIRTKAALLNNRVDHWGWRA